MGAKGVLGLVLVLVVGCSTSARGGPAEKSWFSTVSMAARQSLVRAIIRSPLNPQTKVTLLKPFVRVGQSIEEVDENLGSISGIDGYGPGFIDRIYEIRIQVSFYPDGEAYAIGYFDANGQYVGLVLDGPVTWPKTKKAK